MHSNWLDLLRLSENKEFLKSEFLMKLKNCFINEINDFIKFNYKKSEENFYYFFAPENLEIQCEHYRLLSISTDEDKNKVSIIRLTLNGIVSVISNRKIGSILFCDSFFNCYGEIFNFTHDIVSLKYFTSTNAHLKGKEDNSYNLVSLIKSQSELLVNEVDIKGLSFYLEDYNIPYFFPDSLDLGFDSNQSFLIYDSKLVLYDKYLVIRDNSLGDFVIQYENFESICFKDEIKYSVLLLKIRDSSKIPLSNILKNEILFYFPCISEREKKIKYEVFSHLKQKVLKFYRGMTKREELEYELAIKVLRDNPNENLNYISNSFNLTTIFDKIGGLYDFEYFLSEKALDYKDYNKISDDLINSNNSYDTSFSNDRTNIFFIFGSLLDKLEIFSLSVHDLMKTLGIKSEILIPDISYTNHPIELYKFYLSKLEQTVSSNKNEKIKKTIILVVQSEHRITDFFCNLFKFQNEEEFFSSFQVLGISSLVNLNFIKNKSGSFFPSFRNIIEEELIDYIFLDQGDYVDPSVLEKKNQLITMMNSKAEIINTRSIFKNTKDAKKIFEIKNDFRKRYQYVKKFKIESQEHLRKDCLFIPFRYKLERDLFEDFIEKINIPLKYTIESKNNLPTPFEDGSAFLKISEDEFQKELSKMVKEVKSRESEPVIEKIVGFTKFLDSDKTYKFQSYYKGYVIEEVNTKILNLNYVKNGIIISGENIIQNKEYLEQMITSLSGNMPEIKHYRKKEDLSEEEIWNLNVLNFFKDLPEGWYWDGPVIVDIEGNRYNKHPCKLI
jgi:hypothetical protein